MGAPAKKDGKACEGFKIFTGGKIGENPELAKEFAQVGPCVTGMHVITNTFLPSANTLV